VHKKKRIIEIVLLLMVGVVVIVISALPTGRVSDPVPVEEDNETVTEYGIVVDSLVVFKDRVRPNQYLSTLLTPFGVSLSTVDQMSTASKGIFDLRKLRAGNPYAVLCTNDSAGRVCYFIYEDSPFTYIVFDVKDSIHVHRGEKEVRRTLRMASGEITTSLWNAMTERDADPVLALELSDIYAWTIDFFGIQKGDAYKILYTDLSVDGIRMGIDRILATGFLHKGQEYLAFYYVQDSVGNYFDEKGQNLKRAFLKAPLVFRRISSRFSHSRLHPVLKTYRPHHGVDYAAPSGTPVHTIGDGTVIKAGWSGGAGRMVKIRHNSVYTTAYLHLSGFAKGIRQGARVHQGDVIGYVGSSGLSTGSHLDFRVYRNGSPVNPLTIQSPPAPPVPEASLPRYLEYIRGWKALLDSTPKNEKDRLLPDSLFQYQKDDLTLIQAPGRR
jgi:murein DD-endopeptidase MepM/ murein hydrolase activator NlpD